MCRPWARGTCHLVLASCLLAGLDRDAWSAPTGAAPPAVGRAVRAPAADEEATLFEGFEEREKPSHTERQAHAIALQRIHAAGRHVALDERLAHIARCLLQAPTALATAAEQEHRQHRCARIHGATDGEWTAFTFFADPSRWPERFRRELDDLLAANDGLNQLGIAIDVRSAEGPRRPAVAVAVVASRRLLRLLPLPKHIGPTRPLFVAGTTVDPAIFSVRLFVRFADQKSATHRSNLQNGAFLFTVDGSGVAGPLTAQLVIERGRGPEVAAQWCVNVGSGGILSGQAEDEVKHYSGTFLDILSQLRHEHGLLTPRPMPALDILARAHALDMANHAFFAHRSPSRGDALQRAREAGLRFSRLVENLAIAPDATQAFSGWMQSPSHRANLLDEAVEVVGWASANDPAEPGMRLYILLMAKP